MSKREDETPEEGVEEGLSGQPAVEKAIELMRNGVKTIDLASRDIDNEGSVALGEELATNASLVSLFLDFNKIGDSGAVGLGEGLGKNRSLTYLNLYNNNIGDDGAVGLGQGLGKNSSLTKLYLVLNRIGDSGAVGLGEGLGKNRSLTFMDLYNNNIGDSGAVGLGEGLGKNSSLTSLDLEENDIGPDGAVGLGEGLGKNSSLTELNLSANNIGDSGAVGLGECLGKNSSLTYLGLYNNNIGDDGAVGLGEGLGKNSSLTELNLSGNNIGDVGAEALVSALEKNTSLEVISLDEDKISAGILARIPARIELRSKDADEAGKAAVEALKANKKVRWGRAKLMVVGKGAAGKTSTIRTLLDQPVNLVHESTIGVDLSLISTHDWKERHNISDSDLGELLSKLQYRRQSFAKRVSRRASLAATRVSRSRKSASSPVPMRFNEREVAKAVSTPLRLHVKEKAGEPDEEISFTIWDYGGQEVFYALHHLFLTQYGVYVLVFDMREVLGKEHLEDILEEEEVEKLASQEEALETLCFWIDSIRLHAPNVKIAIVGTYLDEVSSLEQHKEIDQILRTKVLNKKHGGLSTVIGNTTGKGKKKTTLYFFPIDNTDRQDADERVSRLRVALSVAAAKEDFVKEKVPVRWSYCLEQLLSQDVDYLSLDAVRKLAEERCYVPKENVDKMLKFMHELGVLVHLTSGQNDMLSQIVVIRPQWLLENLSRVICDPDMGHMERHKQRLLSDKDFSIELRDALERWSTRGVASRELLEGLWEGQPVEYLTELMKSMLLACPSPWIGDEDEEDEDEVDEEGALLLPSILRPVDDDVKREAFEQLGGDYALAYVDFRVLPQGVFQRLVASIVQSLSDYMRVFTLCANFASINFDNVGVILETTGQRVMFYFETPKDKHLTHHVQILKRSLDSINSHFMKGNLGPRLFVSSNGTDLKAACASMKKLEKALTKGNKMVPSLGIGSLPVSSFAIFADSSEEAKRLLRTDKRFHAFLSHDWGVNHETHAVVQNVAKALEARGINCWLDTKDMKQDILKSMADGIDQSKVVIVFVTSRYMEKVNKERTEDDYCRTEFYYALESHKPANMIPCVLESGLDKTSSWHNAFRAGWSGNPLFVSMLGGGLEKEVDELASQVREVIALQEEAASRK